MHLNLEITDMAGAMPEHSIVITNFVNMVYNQLQDSLCRVFPDNIQYRWRMEDGTEKTVIPDASINCRMREKRGNSFIGAPQFVLEVLSPSTEKYDRTEKKELYCQEEISEYWIADWRTRTVEMYQLDYKEGRPQYYLWKIVTEENKDELNMLHFPIKINFDKLFDGTME